MTHPVSFHSTYQFIERLFRCWYIYVHKKGIWMYHLTVTGYYECEYHCLKKKLMKDNERLKKDILFLSCLFNIMIIYKISLTALDFSHPSKHSIIRRLLRVALNENSCTQFPIG